MGPEGCEFDMLSLTLALFFSVKAERGKEASEEMFEGNRGQFMRFKRRHHFHNIKVPGEVASADGKAAASYPGYLAKRISKGSHTKPIFNAEEITLYWKKMPSRNRQE